MAKPKLKDEVRCERTDLTPDDIAIYEVDSRSRVGVVHRPVVNLRDGGCDCPCKYSTYKLVPQARLDQVLINIWAHPYLCFHLKLAIMDCVDRGDITMSLKRSAPDEP